MTNQQRFRTDRSETGSRARLVAEVIDVHQSRSDRPATGGRAIWRTIAGRRGASNHLIRRQRRRRNDEAALSAGFGSYAQFHRVYRARFGKSPRKCVFEPLDEKTPAAK